jgi:VanZ family protein
LDAHTLALAIWTLTVSYGSLTPPSGLPSFAGDVSDKLGHGLMYLIFAILLLRAWVRRGTIPPSAAAGAVLVAAAWGFYLECLQIFSIDRTFDLSDGAANAAGAVVGVLVLVAWRRRFPGCPGDAAPPQSPPIASGAR